MEYRKFGPTDMTVSVMGFGCQEMGGGYGDFSESDVIDVVQRAIDLRIKCFDTAQAYSHDESETMLARALGNRRDDVLVATKCGVGYQDRPKGLDNCLWPSWIPLSKACATFGQTTWTFC